MVDLLLMRPSTNKLVYSGYFLDWSNGILALFVSLSLPGRHGMADPVPTTVRYLGTDPNAVRPNGHGLSFLNCEPNLSSTPS